MNKKRTLSTTISVVLALILIAASLIGVSAVPLSPYIMVVPETTIDETLTPGNTYTISIYTDYDWDTDVWSWQFSLTYNPAVLNGTTVVNGDLITTVKNASAVFIPGDFNNTKGELDVTVGFFDPAYYDPPEYFSTSGPGTLAIVSFDVIGYGSSDIVLLETKTRLDGVIGSFTYSIINGLVDWDHLGHGYFKNTLTGDADGDGTVNVFDILKVKYHWYPGPPAGAGGYDRDVDCDDDGSINVFDILIVKANWGDSV